MTFHLANSDPPVVNNSSNHQLRMHFRRRPQNALYGEIHLLHHKLSKVGTHRTQKENGKMVLAGPCINHSLSRQMSWYIISNFFVLRRKITPKAFTSGREKKGGKWFNFIFIFLLVATDITSFFTKNGSSLREINTRPSSWSVKLILILLSSALKHKSPAPLNTLSIQQYSENPTGWILPIYRTVIFRLVITTPSRLSKSLSISENAEHLYQNLKITKIIKIRKQTSSFMFAYWKIHTELN